MSDEGFKKDTVINSDTEGDCPYTISVDGESTLFDPINLSKEYKKTSNQYLGKIPPIKNTQSS